MTIHQQKLELINWILSINSKQLLNEVEKIKKKTGTHPDEILQLLDESAKDDSKTTHTSAHDLI